MSGPAGSSQWMYKSGGYEIANSLRLNRADAAFLTHTPTAGNVRLWTFSIWFKLGALGTYRQFLGVRNSDQANLGIYIGDDDLIHVSDASGGATNLNLITERILRDTSAWYHLVVAMDTAQSTASNRTKVYLNGTRITDFDTETYADQNYDTWANTANPHNIGAFKASSNHFDGHLAEINLVEDVALTPTSFGETDDDYGHWKPRKYVGAYGSEGFYLDFRSSGVGTAGQTTVGADRTGNTNHFTSANVAATDQMIDTPTNNFATWNPLYESGGTTISEGNLQVSVPTNKHATNNFSPTSGKWYTEICVKTVGSTNGEMQWGWIFAPDYTDTAAHGGKANNWGAYYHAYSTDHIKLYDEATEGTNINMTIVAEDILQLVLDIDNAKGWIGRNNVFYAADGGTDGNPATGANPTFTYTAAESVDLVNYVANGTGTDVFVANFGQDSSFAGILTAQGNQDANGIGDFYYAPPTGFLALCTKNLPEPDFVPSEYFNTVLYTGSGQARNITGVGFQPDWVWTKSRNGVNNHQTFDSVRGATNALETNTTAANSDENTSLTAFASDGFALGTSANVNNNNITYVAWNWKANGSGSSNTDGTITTTVSANVDAGFSIITYSGTDAAATIGHGLSKKPELVFFKNTVNSQGASAWDTYSAAIGATKHLSLNSTAAEVDSATRFNDTEPTATLISLKNSYHTNYDTIIAYAFHSVDNYSKVGSYIGNGNADGTFVYTGFRPAYILYKSTDNVTHWAIHNTKSNPHNVADTELHANESAAEAVANEYKIDILSNGFKQRNTNGTNNGNGFNYVYIAFAETSFKYSNAR